MSHPITYLGEGSHRVWTGVDQPGNGSRYEYCIWVIDHQWYAVFPDYGRAARIGAGHNHWSYIAEKFHVSNPDAVEMARIINDIQESAS